MEHLDREARQIRGPQIKAKAYHQGKRHQDHGKKRQATQAGNWGRVYLSRIRDIIQSFLVGDHQDPRDDHHAQRHGDQISGQ